MKKSLIVLFLILFSFQCQNYSKIIPITQTRLLMDTFVQIVVYDQDKSKHEINRIIGLAFDRIQQIDNITNSYNDSSLISFVNQNGASYQIQMDSVLYHVVKESQRISTLSKGNFDITTGAVKDLWDFNNDNPFVPDSTVIRKTLKLVDYKLLSIDSDYLGFKTSGMKIDLGAIAKGFAIDEAVRILSDHGIHDAMVNAGGDLKTICTNLTAGKRKVWINHPRNTGEMFGFFRMDSGSVATSGDYERFFIKDSIRYHHILDPKTGYPAGKCISVTIIAKNALTADALATAVFVMGPEQGMIFVENQAFIECIILYKKDGKLIWTASTGIKDKFYLAN